MGEDSTLFKGTLTNNYHEQIEVTIELDQFGIRIKDWSR